MPRLRFLSLLVFVLTALACARGHDAEGTLVDPGGAKFDIDSGAPCEGEGCKPPCLAAAENRSSVGCEYWAVDMDGDFAASNGCFVAFVANTFEKPAHIDVSFAGESIDLTAHAKIPRGAGKSIHYEDFDLATGLPPGEVAILFLAGTPDTTPRTDGDFMKPVACPVVPARSTLAQRHGTGIGQAFHIRTDVPVVSYQMLPYGGGSAAVTGATLLVPTSAWDTNYLAATAYRALAAGKTSMNVVASEDDTTVTILPNVDIVAGAGLPRGAAGTAVEYKLNKGQHLQITQPFEITGSPIQADKPIGLFAGYPCLNVPLPINYCDHAEQAIPPIRALGHEYLAVPHRSRTPMGEKPPYRLIGAVDGTVLQYDPPVSGPHTLKQGEVVEFETDGTPFRVRSQDKEHPFLFVTYMTGSTAVQGPSTYQGYGDADFHRIVPTTQYLDHYVFFTDPTYPETNLVITRQIGSPDVELDCAGVLTGWEQIGTTGFEFTRIDLVRHDFVPQNGCDNGRHVMKSGKPFGLAVWGWGTTETKTFTRDVSYSYPAGENLAAINTVVVPARPK
ncbi:MAG: IgGFc-binding protein [Polyangiales bacterium]